MLTKNSISIPNDVNYWLNKGKDGKKVAIYFHDDLDGIYSAVAMKGYLLKNNFEIIQYGIVNYQEGWSLIELNPKLINIALDYAENKEGIDVYIDHHGKFEEMVETDDKTYENAVKTNTASAYEGIMLQLGLPVDSLVLSVIDMIDGAKYDDYNVDIKNILTFDIKLFKNRLEFAASFNQLLKRSDHKTFIEVVANINDINPSIYNLYRMFKILYPFNNLNTFELKKLAKKLSLYDISGNPNIDKVISCLINTKKILPYEKDFLEDADWRLKQMQTRSRGNIYKEYIISQDHFKSLFQKCGIGNNTKIELPGYQIIGNLVFFPTGTWANALRARAIIEQDIINGNIPDMEYIIDTKSPLYNDLKSKMNSKLELVGDIKNNVLCVKKDVTNLSNIEGINGTLIYYNGQLIFKAKRPILFIMLQYGNTLQIATLHNVEKYVREYLPKLKDGSVVDDIGVYCDKLLLNMCKKFAYNCKLVKNSTTKTGGHTGIGNFSNIFGEVRISLDLSVPDPKNSNSKVDVDDDSKKYKGLYNGVKFLDLIKNKIIQDLSGILWNDLKMCWSDPDEKRDIKPNIDEINKKVILSKDVRNVDDVYLQYKKWENEISK